MGVWLLKSTWMLTRNFYVLVSGKSSQGWHSGSKVEGWQVFQVPALSTTSQCSISLQSVWDPKESPHLRPQPCKCPCPWKVLVIIQQGAGWEANTQPVLHSCDNGINSHTAGDAISMNLFLYNLQDRAWNPFTGLRIRWWKDHPFSRGSRAVLSSENMGYQSFYVWFLTLEEDSIENGLFGDV